MTAPAFPYYGGKGRLADWIVSLLPPHRVYVEPFAGSAAVLLAKAVTPHEILNDLDGDIVRFFRVLRDRPDELARMCRLTPYARDEFTACAQRGDDLDDLERARRWWTRLTQSYGKITSGTGWSTSAIRGVNKAHESLRLVDRFHAVAERLRQTTIDNRPAVDAVALYGTADAVIYADPPYLASTHAGATKRARDYQLEYRTDDEHRELAAALHQTPATVLLSGYPSELYDELYTGWNRIERTVTVHGTRTRGGTQRQAVEVVWSNRAFPAQLPLDLDPDSRRNVVATRP